MKGRKSFKKQIGPGAKLDKKLSRADRINNRKQALAIKRLALEKKDKLEGGNNKAPHFVTILSLDTELLSTEALERLLNADEDSVVSRSQRGALTYLNVPRFKSRYAFACPNQDNLESLLDCLKVSEVLMILWPTDGEITEEQKLLLDIILSHGTSTPMHLVAGLPPSSKQRESLRKAVAKTIDKWSSTKSGVYFFDSNTDMLQILRQLPTIRKKAGVNQSRRPYMFVDNAEMADVSNGMGTLKLTGYIRGAPLNVNKLIHIQGWGNFQMSKIISVKDPRALRKQKHKMETDETVLATADPEKQESLQSEIIPDPMDTEQPDPLDGESVFKVPKMKKRVPKGMSEYQAEWIVDDKEQEKVDDEDEDDMEFDESEDEFESDEESLMENERIKMDLRPIDDEMSVMGEQMPSHSQSVSDSVSMFGIEDKIDEIEVKQFREEVENLQWPDHVDAPMDQLACERFQRYRGLKSFRTSPWDAKESLPVDYARIFKFANFSRTKRLALDEILFDTTEEKANEVVMAGNYVIIYLKDVPSHILDDWHANKPLIIHGLLRNEQKFSLMNVVLRKYSQCTIPIKSKQTLIFHVGYRRFEVDAIFSQHSNGNKFKLERYMPDREPFVASYYGPVTYGPCPVLVFRKDEDGQKHFVAYGSVADANPDRIVLKRIILSGHPYKITKRAAIVRFMFFNKEDIEWFKPVELYTDGGNHGHIKDSVGTHGIMKAVFNIPLKKQDQVKMNLYKRVFPRWTYNPHVAPDPSEPMLELRQQAVKDVEMDE